MRERDCTVPAAWEQAFRVQQAPDGTPRACLNGLPNEYLINVTCLHSRLYAKLAFQLGHELGHFFVDPHFSNWFVESVCTGVSFLTLDALAAKWTTAPPFPNWRGYASSFTVYRQQMVGDALAKVRHSRCAGHIHMDSDILGKRHCRWQLRQNRRDAVCAHGSQYHARSRGLNLGYHTASGLPLGWPARPSLPPGGIVCRHPRRHSWRTWQKRLPTDSRDRRNRTSRMQATLDSVPDPRRWTWIANHIFMN